MKIDWNAPFELNAQNVTTLIAAAVIGFVVGYVGTGLIFG